MLFQIVSLLLEVVVGLVAGTCLLRLYMQQQGIPLSARYNPLGRFIFALTDWIVLPLRRLLPSMGRLDTASLVAAFLLELAQFGLLWVLAGGMGSLVSVGVLAFFGLVRLTISGLSGLVMVYAVLSWMPTRSTPSSGCQMRASATSRSVTGGAWPVLARSSGAGSCRGVPLGRACSGRSAQQA